MAVQNHTQAWAFVFESLDISIYRTEPIPFPFVYNEDDDRFQY